MAPPVPPFLVPGDGEIDVTKGTRLPDSPEFLKAYIDAASRSNRFVVVALSALIFLGAVVEQEVVEYDRARQELAMRATRANRRLESHNAALARTYPGLLLILH